MRHSRESGNLGTMPPLQDPRLRGGPTYRDDGVGALGRRSRTGLLALADVSRTQAVVAVKGFIQIL